MNISEWRRHTCDKFELVKLEKPDTEVLGVYKLLLKFFGYQGWWPVTRLGKTVPQYCPKRYRLGGDSERFEVCVGAILTQNTAWKNVEKALACLHEAKVLSPAAISSLNQKKLAGYIRASGYYNQKAERLKLFTQYLVKNYSGKLSLMFKKPVNNLRKELLSLKGIGPETADSIILYAASKPVFVVDAYTQRLVKRLGWLDKSDYDSAQKYFVNNLPKKIEIYNEFHALIVAFGKDFCKKKPKCEGCPVSFKCLKGY